MIKNYNIAAEEYVNNGGGNMVMVYTVWLPDEKRMLYVNIDEENTAVTTVDTVRGLSQFDIDEIGGYDAVTLLLVYNSHWWHDGINENQYANIAAHCYTHYMQEINNAKVTVERTGCYAEAYDTTFIMEYTYINDYAFSSEVVGWYCGTPTDEYNEQYGDYKMLTFN